MKKTICCSHALLAALGLASGVARADDAPAAPQPPAPPTAVAPPPSAPPPGAWTAARPAPAPAATPAPSTPQRGAAPPPYVYQDPTPLPGQQPPPGWGQPGAGAPQQPYAPVAPGYAPPPRYVYADPYAQPWMYEPPPPPPVMHRAPAAALWLGARFGYFTPFGKVGYDDPYYGTGPDWRDYGTPGPSFELDLGGRFSRRYVVYGLVQGATMGLGRADDVANRAKGKQTNASTSLVGLGLRWTSDPDEVGFLVDLALGYRKFRAEFEDGATLEMTSPFEVRIGLGADIRATRAFAISPQVLISNGVFSDMSFTAPGQPTTDVPNRTGGLASATHGSVEFALGGHFDLLGH